MTKIISYDIMKQTADVFRITLENSSRFAGVHTCYRLHCSISAQNDC